MKEKIVYDPTKDKEISLQKNVILEKIENNQGKIKGKQVKKKKSVIQAEGEAHIEDVEKVDKIVEQKVAEVIVEKTSPFPADARINDYGFLGFKRKWLEELGWKKGMALKIERNTDGSITLRKA